MKPTTKVLMLYLLLLCSSIVWAQGTIQLKSENIFQKNGLGSVQVNAIAQDKFGFLWLGTMNGLYKYDGYTLQLFKTNHEGKTLLSSYIANLFFDSKNNLWILNDENGLNRYNILTDKLDQYVSDKKNENTIANNHVEQIIEDKNGNYWLATNDGLDKLEIKADSKGSENVTITHFKSQIENSGSLPGMRINSVLPSGNSIWCGTDAGLCEIDISSNNVTRHLEITSGEDKNSTITCIVEDKTHNVWIGTSSSGIWMLNKSLTGQPVFTQVIKSTDLSNAFVSSLMFDNNFNLWIGTKGGGAIKYNLISQKADDIAQETTGGKRINALFRDVTGVIWMAHENGLNKVLDKKQFSNLEFANAPFNFKDNVYVYAVLEDMQGNVWMGTEKEGLYKYNPQTKSVIHYSVQSQPPYKLKSNDVYALAENKFMIYIGTSTGLNVVNKLTGACIQLPDQLYDLNINSISMDSKGDIWMGLMNYGICKLDYLTWQCTFYQDDEKTKSAENGNNDVKSILCGKDNLLYLATDSGLKVFNTISKTFKRYRSVPDNPLTISSNRVTAMYQDKEGKLWVTTNNGGFNLFNPQSEEFTRIRCQYLNENTEVYSILPDSKNNLWLSTKVGIVKYEKFSNNFVLFDKTDGTISKEFNAGAFFKNKRGDIYYGGINGITIFNPDSIATFTGDFKMAYNSVQANNHTLAFEFNDKGEQMVTLNPDEYSFSIDFTALNFIAPEKIQYAIKLEGVDKDWISKGNNHSINYNNLSPGVYHFKFRASMGEGDWKESPTDLVIIIKPPFYKTWWFLALISILITSSAYTIIRLRVMRITEQKKKEVEMQSIKMKHQFLANMSHEIRTPMNSVIGFTTLLQDTPLNNEQKNYLSAIQSQAENLLVIINDILDFSKIDAGKIILNKEPVLLQKIIDKVYSTLYLKAQEKGLYFVIEKLSDVPNVIFTDEVRMYQILTNLLNNAIKFTEKGKVGLQIMKLEENEKSVQLQFKVYDTGIGIPQEKLPIIFDLFTQVNMDSAKKFGGTGLGLSITRQLVQLHGGAISVESEENNGTTFHVDIPFEKIEQLGKADKQELPPAAQHHINGKTNDLKIAPVKTEKEEQAPKHKPHILLAEDNTFNQMLAKTVINKYLPDADLTIANNGKEVMKHLNNGSEYDIILMDVQMPEMDGFETTRTIRHSNNPRYATIPIIACTAGVTPPEVEECYKSGMDDFLAKPFQPNDLVNKINYHINTIKDSTNN